MPISTDRLAEMISKVDEKVTGLDRQGTRLDEKVSGLDEKFTRLDDKVTKLDDKVTKLDGRVTKLDDRVTRLDEKVTWLDDKVTKVDDKVTKVDDKVTKVDDKLVAFQIETTREFGSIKGDIRSLMLVFSALKWVAGLLIPVTIGLIGTAISLAYSAAKLDVGVQNLSRRLDKLEEGIERKERGHAIAPVVAAGDDPVRELQERAVATAGEKATRAYHFGSQGVGGVFANHSSHSNRLIPVYTFGGKVDLGSVTGKNSRYRTALGVRPLYGAVPENTVNPEAEYADQSDLYRVQKDAVARGAKYMFTVWFDGMDYETTRAAAIVRARRVAYAEGKGMGLAFQDYGAAGTARFGYYVTSPTHDRNTPDLDAQAVTIPDDSMLGGYDAMIAGPNPWTPGPLAARAPGYLKGQSADATDRAGVADVGRVLHAYTDSSQSAGEYATGVKAYNNGVNVADDGRFAPTFFEGLQKDGWKVGTVTSVPFDHVSPAAMYAHNVHRDDYQDLGREMLGLPSITQSAGREGPHAGLDVVIGTGYGQVAKPGALAKQGKNAVEGNLYLADADLARIDAAHGGKYVVIHTDPDVDGSKAVREAAARAAADGRRLFGFFGSGTIEHLPYRTADGDFRPVAGPRSKAEAYTPAEVAAQPTLAAMTDAALVALSAGGKPFALFVEAGDVDWALHDNNLDNAIGAVHSGEDAVRAIIAWVEKNSNWDESVLIVTADHGHYLVLDDPAALLGKK